MISHPLTPVADAASLAFEVRRTAAALLDDAMGHACDPGRVGADAAVHEVRKRIKELRALLRLAGPWLIDERSGPVHPRENDALRIAAGALGEARDAAVMLQTLDALVGDSGMAPQELQALRRVLSRRAEEHDPRGGGFEAARQILEAVRARSAEWRFAGEGEAWAQIGPNLRRIYRRGRRAMRAAGQTADAEAWHAWRRRAKDLRYALELLRLSAPPIMEGSISVARKLTDRLGEDHDLAVLLEFIRAAEPPLMEQATASALNLAAQSRSGKLRCTAMRDGEWLYGERPRALARRIGAYWNTRRRSP